MMRPVDDMYITLSKPIKSAVGKSTKALNPAIAGPNPSANSNGNVLSLRIITKLTARLNAVPGARTGTQDILGFFYLDIQVLHDLGFRVDGRIVNQLI